MAKKVLIFGNDEKEDWGTPQSLFDCINKEFKFTADVCASAENAKCSVFYTKTMDGLSIQWGGTCWCNPPYGRKIPPWVVKAFLEAKNNRATTVMIVPAKTDTAWWHEFAMKASEIRFVRGRVSFVGAGNNSAPGGSALLVFRAGSVGGTPKVSSWSYHKTKPTSNSGGNTCQI